MRRFCSLLLSLTLLFGISAHVYAIDISKTGTASKERYSGMVTQVTAADLNEELDFDALTNVINKNGIVIIDGAPNEVIFDELDFPFSVSSVTSRPNSINFQGSTVDPGVDVATIVYGYGHGEKGIAVINVGSGDKLDDRWLEDVLLDVQELQHMTIISNSSIAPTRSEQYDDAKRIGQVSLYAIREPKGKLVATYTIYTLQGFYEQDFYTVESTVTGYPGANLVDDNTNYEEKYQGEGMSVEFSSGTSSTEVDTYAPERDKQSGSYSFQVGNSFDGKTMSVSWSHTVSFDLKDTIIDVSGSNSRRTWDLTIKDPAQATLCTFQLPITFNCPETKSSITIDTLATYDLDSWNTFPETISIERSIKCTPNSADKQ